MVDSDCERQVVGSDSERQAKPYPLTAEGRSKTHHPPA